MRIATNRCYTRVPKVKYVALEACFLEERNDKAPKATIHVQADVVFCCKCRQFGDVVHASVREVHRRTDDLLSGLRERGNETNEKTECNNQREKKKDGPLSCLRFYTFAIVSE